MNNTFLNGKLSIGNPQGGQREGEIFTIEIVDDTSRVEFLEIEITPHDFAMAIKGRAQMPCRFKLRKVDLVGMTQENCSVIVEVPYTISYGKNKEQEGAELLAQHALCAEGWKGYVSDLFNGHKCVGVEDKISRQRVGFYRWVPTAKLESEVEK